HPHILSCSAVSFPGFALLHSHISNAGPSFPSFALRQAHIPNRRAHPFPSLLGKVARRAGWGMARFFKPSRLARPSARTNVGAYLVSTPHPPLRGTFPASRRRGLQRRPGARSWGFGASE